MAKLQELIKEKSAKSDELAGIFDSVGDMAELSFKN